MLSTSPTVSLLYRGIMVIAYLIFCQERIGFAVPGIIWRPKYSISKNILTVLAEIKLLC